MAASTTKTRQEHTKPHPGHSPIFYVWEVITLACVIFVAEAYFGHPYIHVDEQTEHLLEVAVEGAEIILISEVVLLILIARNKINYIKRNWLSIATVLPLGGNIGAVKVLKLVWHTFEKTRVGHFLKHPIRYTREWIRRKLGLPRQIVPKI
jgi:hypothetical protein